MATVAVQLPPAPVDTAAITEIISFMSSDKSNDWTAEIETLTAADAELDTLRREVETYRANVGPLENIVDTSRYARLGEYTAVRLGANLEWSGADICADIANTWGRIGSPAIADQSSEDLAHWRVIADRLGIEYDPEIVVEEIEPASIGEHAPTFVPSEKYPQLFQVFCACGKSSFGTTLRSSAEATHARHIANPGGDVYRDEAATRTLLELIDPESKLLPAPAAG